MSGWKQQNNHQYVFSSPLGRRWHLCLTLSGPSCVLLLTTRAPSGPSVTRASERRALTVLSAAGKPETPCGQLRDVDGIRESSWLYFISSIMIFSSLPLCHAIELWRNKMTSLANSSHVNAYRIPKEMRSFIIFFLMWPLLRSRLELQIVQSNLSFH